MLLACSRIMLALMTLSLDSDSSTEFNTGLIPKMVSNGIIPTTAASDEKSAG